MKNRTLTIPFIAMIAIALLPIQTTTAQLKLDGTPHFGVVRLEAGFEDDPKIIQVVSGGRVDVAALSLCGDCAGYASSTPDVRLVWKGSDSDLVVFFEANDDSHDATLIINTPEAKWLGNDDESDSTLNPMIRLKGHGEGVYDIWVGSFSSGERIRGVLKITELDSERPR